MIQKVKSIINRIRCGSQSAVDFQHLKFDGKTSDLYSNIYLDKEKANSRISELVTNRNAALICRIGASELKTINNYIVSRLCRDGQVGIDKKIKEELYTHSGFFPDTDEAIFNFSNIYLDAIRAADMIGVWQNVGEPTLLKLVNPIAQVTELSWLEPYFHKHPWSAFLAGKRVLVIHPFRDTILAQYEKREKLFRNKEVLPAFEPIVYKAVQTLSHEDKRFGSWFEALDTMKNDISGLNFDIALIGAGAYGLPLASFVKTRMSKTAIHLGGALQVLFGIRGKRWDNMPEFEDFINANWMYPLDQDNPTFGHLVDGYGPYTK